MVAVVTGAVGCGKIRTISQWLPGQDTAVMSTNGTPIHSSQLGHQYTGTQLGHHTKQILGQEDVTRLGQ